MGKSMLDIAFDVISKHKKPVPFIKIWDSVCTSKKYSEAQKEDKVADFFSDMTLDERFVNVGENKWDIKARHKFDEVFVNTENIAVDEDFDDEDVE